MNDFAQHRLFANRSVLPLWRANYLAPLNKDIASCSNTVCCVKTGLELGGHELPLSGQAIAFLYASHRVFLENKWGVIQLATAEARGSWVRINTAIGVWDSLEGQDSSEDKKKRLVTIIAAGLHKQPQLQWCGTPCLFCRTKRSQVPSRYWFRPSLPLVLVMAYGKLLRPTFWVCGQLSRGGLRPVSLASFILGPVSQRLIISIPDETGTILPNC